MELKPNICDRCMNRIAADICASGVFAVMYSHEWITLPAQGRDIWACLIACVEEICLSVTSSI